MSRKRHLCGLTRECDHVQPILGWRGRARVSPHRCRFRGTTRSICLGKTQSRISGGLAGWPPAWGRLEELGADRGVDEIPVLLGGRGGWLPGRSVGVAEWPGNPP